MGYSALKQVNGFPRCSIRGVARCFLRAGFSAIPLLPNSKTPSIRWKDYQKTLMGEVFIDQFFKNDSGLALVCGQISDLTVIDIDSPEKFNGFFPLNSLMRECGSIVKTPHGFHLYFRYHNGLKSESFNSPFGFEIKSNQTLITAPPTRINNFQYSFLKLEKLTPIPEPLLEKILSLREKAMKQDYQKHKKDVDLKEVLKRLHSITGHTPQERAPGIWRTKCPAHADEVPSLDVEMVEGEIQFRCWAGCDRKEIFEALGVKEEKWTKQSPKINYQLTSLEEVFQYPETSFLIDPILINGTVSILGAYTGTGKSLIALSIIKSVLTGDPLWGKYSVLRTGPVILVDEETPQSFLKERLKKMKFKENLPLYFLHFQGVRLDKDEFFDALMLRIEEVKPILVVIDSLIRVHRQREDEASSMSVVIERLRKIANSGTTVLVIHHHRKAEGPLNQKLRGSSDIPGGVDVEYALIPKDEFLLFSSVKSRTKPFTPIRIKIEVNEEKIEILYQGEEGDEKNEILSEVFDILKGGELGVKEIHRELLEQGFEIGINRLRSLLRQASERKEISQEKGLRGKVTYKLLPASQLHTPIYTRETVKVEGNEESSFTDSPSVSDSSRETQTLDNQYVEASFTASRNRGREGQKEALEVVDLSDLEVEVLP